MSFPKHMRKAWGKRVGWKCERCGRKYSQGYALEFHHKLPTSMGGEDSYDNIICCCLMCHLFYHEQLVSVDIRQQSSVNIIRGRINRNGIRIRGRKIRLKAKHK